MFTRIILICCFTILTFLHNNAQTKAVRLITLDPGHFHASLIQKTMYDEVDSVVYVYAPSGNDLEQHLERISSYNSRAVNPTTWKQEVYTGNDFFEKMLSDKQGNVVVIAGNNRKKNDYIFNSLHAGFNVFADKPMAIDTDDFEKLTQAFKLAEEKDLILYDIMTERFEITTILQREFSTMPEVFGTLEKGTPDNPSITKESVHHFYKLVSGKPLTRPAWFFDVLQEGEGIVDVMTHLVDLVQWECFPGKALNYKEDIKIYSATHWPTEISLDAFRAITKMDNFPGYLSSAIINDTLIQVYSNGEINYQVRGIHAKTSVTWAYKAPEGTGDTHFSIMRGSKANLVIRQGAEQQYKPVLYIEQVIQDSQYEKVLNEEVKILRNKYPGVELKKLGTGWEVVIPDKYKEGHESHFASVTQKFLEYLQNKNMPAWEVPNMIAKYYTTTKALEMAKKKE